MAHGPFHDPDFDMEPFKADVARWATNGAKRVMIEWQTGPGPTVSWYPDGARQLSGIWHAQVRPIDYNEQYADFLELKLTPKLVAVAKEAGLPSRALCVDQQPIVIMRQRRRELEQAEKASGQAPAHADNVAP